MCDIEVSSVLDAEFAWGAAGFAFGFGSAWSFVRLQQTISPPLTSSWLSACCGGHPENPDLCFCSHDFVDSWACLMVDHYHVFDSADF